MNTFNFLTVFLNLPMIYWEQLESETPEFEPAADFLNLTKQAFFIDKSMMIRNLFQGTGPRLITAPHGFGKSTNLEMLRYFLSMPVFHDKDIKQIRAIYEKLEIYKNDKTFFEKHFAQYPVVHVDLYTGDILKANDTLDRFKDLFHNLYKKHSYVCNNTQLRYDERNYCQTWLSDNYLAMDVDKARKALIKLVDLLNYHYNKKILLLVDNWDVAINRAMMHADSERLILIPFVFHMFSELVQINARVEKIIMTGISYISGSGYNELSDDLETYKFLDDHPLVEYNGFTEAEVEKLFKNPQFNVGNKINQALYRYDGYVSKTGKKIYCPLSVVNFLRSGKVDNYWSNCKHLDVMHRIYIIPSIKYRIFKLFKNEPVHFELINDISLQEFHIEGQVTLRACNKSHDFINLYFSIIFERGYLCYDGLKKPGAKIPTLEIKSVFTNKLREFIVKHHILDTALVGRCANFFDSLNPSLQNTDVTFTQRTSDFYNDLVQLFRTFNRLSETAANETVFDHELFAVVLFANNFQTVNRQLYNQYVNNKGVHFYMIKGDFAVIVDLKHSGEQTPDATAALNQILDGKYYNVFDDRKVTPHKINHYLLFGLSINKQANVSISCLLNSKNINQAVHFPKTSYNIA